MQDDNNKINPEEGKPSDGSPEDLHGNQNDMTDNSSDRYQDEFSTEVPPTSADDRFYLHARKISQMTRLSLLFSLIALMGAAFLLFRYATHGNSENTMQANVTSYGDISQGTKIAFVRADSVQDNYLMTIHFLDSIEKRFKSMEHDLMSKKNDYEKKVFNYYRDVQSGLLKESGALQIKEKLEQEGDNLSRLEDNYASRINELQLTLNEIYFDSLWNFIERHKGFFGVDMVVGYQQGLTNIFFADSSLDITKQVTDLMNEEYIARYPQRKVAKKKK